MRPHFEPCFDITVNRHFDRWFAFSNNMCRASVAGDGADQVRWVFLPSTGATRSQFVCLTKVLSWS